MKKLLYNFNLTKQQEIHVTVVTLAPDLEQI